MDENAPMREKLEWLLQQANALHIVPQWLGSFARAKNIKHRAELRSERDWPDWTIWREFHVARDCDLEDPRDFIINEYNTVHVFMEMLHGEENEPTQK
jgi:hypothetical protein